MKVYSDTLTKNDILDALPKGVSLDVCEPISRPRVRLMGWNVVLRRWGSNRNTNSGQWGAGEKGAASYDDHGKWMAALYAVDPDARLSWWNNSDDFHQGTEYKYANLVEASRP